MRYTISFLMASTAALAEPPLVVTDIPPVHSLAAAVMQGVGEPELLLEKGASEHHAQLRPSQAAGLADAGLVVWVGPELTPWLADALQVRPEGAATLALLAAKDTARQDYAAMGHEGQEEGHGEAGHDEAGHDEAGHEDHDDHSEGEDHSHAGLDPHAWLDPGNAKAWARLIAAELGRLDPENAATYAANAEAAAVAIDAADARARALLAPVQGRPLVAYHDAYGYFAAHYGLTMAGTVALGDAADTGARHLAELQARIGGLSGLCLLPEVQHDASRLAQLAETTGATLTAPLDPVGSSLPPGPQLYPELLTALAQTISSCAP